MLRGGDDSGEGRGDGLEGGGGEGSGDGFRVVIFGYGVVILVSFHNVW